MSLELDIAIRKIMNEKEAFYKEAFKGVKVPVDIRRASERICTSYGIRGLTDPMYIANVIALETGRGDGKGDFHRRDL
jgi:hypothetical protein